MFQIQVINAVVEWEWRLKIEEEKRKNLKGETYIVGIYPPNLVYTTFRQCLISTGGPNPVPLPLP